MHKSSITPKKHVESLLSRRMWFMSHFPVLIVLLPGSVSVSLSSKRSVCLSCSCVHWFAFRNNLGLWTGGNVWYALISSQTEYSEDQECGCTHPASSPQPGLCMESSTDITVKSRSWQHLQGHQKLGFYCATGNIYKHETRSHQPVIVQDRSYLHFLQW